MNRTLTAAAINKLAFEDRLPLFWKFRQASLNVDLNPVQRSMYRLAARYILGNLDNPAYDLLARLQVLEGVAGIVALGPRTSGPWSKNPRQGVKAAQDYFTGTDISPEWFSMANTGLIGKIRGMVRQEINKWTRGREVHFDADDIVQNTLVGLTKDGADLVAKGPVLMQFGHLNPGIKTAIPAGRVTPAEIAGIVGKFFVQRVEDQFQYGDKARAPTETPAGTNILDLQPGSESEVSFAAFLQDLLHSHSPLGQKLERGMRALAGNNEVAKALIDKLVAGEDLGSISAIHKELGGSGSGGSVGWVKEKFYPAVAKMVQKDKDLLAAYWAAVGSVRLAHRVLVAPHS